MMHVDTEKVARRAQAWHRAGIPCWWVTVLSTFGSSSAPPGSVLAVSETEAWAGSIGIANINQAVVRRVLASAPDESIELTLGANAESARAMGLPIGADPVVVQIERIRDDAVAGLEELASLLSQRRSVARSLVSGQVAEAPRFAPVVSADLETVVHHPSWRLIMTSATPLTVEIGERVSSLGFACDVIEPREPFQATWPQRTTLAHCRVHTRSVEEAVAAMHFDERTAVLALAHDPELDDPLLMATRDAPLFLVGALGSKANHAGRLERLRAAGATDQALARIHGPVGLDIGSRTPAEIGVSIVAQLIAARRDMANG